MRALRLVAIAAAAASALPAAAQMAPAAGVSERVMRMETDRVLATPRPICPPTTMMRAGSLGAQGDDLAKQVAQLQESVTTQRKYIALLEGEVERLKSPAKP